MDLLDQHCKMIGWAIQVAPVLADIFVYVGNPYFLLRWPNAG